MCTARNSKGATQWVLSISRISRLLAAWLGELSLLRYRLLWEKHWIMHPWRNGGLAAASNNNPHTPYHLRTDRWVHLDEVSQEVSTAYVGLIDTLGRFSLASVFCTISPNGKKWHFLPSLIWWGGGEGGEEGPVASSKDECSMTGWWYIWAWGIGWGWLWGTLHRLSKTTTIFRHTDNELWGQKVILLTALSLP